VRASELGVVQLCGNRQSEFIDEEMLSAINMKYLPKADGVTSVLDTIAL